jgi:hypothetical protein
MNLSRRTNPRPLRIEQLETRNLMAVINMTAQEQLMIELLNRARAAPAAEASRFGIDLNKDLPPGTISPTPKQPLAPDQILIQAAGGHSQDMLNRDYFSHTSPEQKSPTDRASALGYSGSVGENISWGGSTGSIDQNDHVYQRHEGLFLSQTHRSNLMTDGYRDVGTGVRYGIYTQGGTDYNSSMVTQNFGFGSGAYITGVVFADTVRANQFYDIGEGLGQINVVATASDGRVFETTTGSSGGYRILVPSGSYSVLFTKDGRTSGEPRQVTIGSQNVKVDFSGALVETGTLSLSVNVASFSEDAGRNVARLTVTRSGYPLNSPLAVQLIGDSTEIDMPATIQIPVGSASIEVPLHAVDDSLLDGTVRVAIRASAGPVTSPPLNIDVTDAESIRLSASVTRFAENAGSGASVITVSRSNTDFGQPVTVRLVSSDTSELTVPETVIIPAGQQSTTVGVSAVDDNLFDGMQSVRVDATATLYTPARVDFQVDDFQTLQVVFPNRSPLVESDSNARQTQATIQLRSIAPAGGMTIRLESIPAGSVSIPSTVLMPAGQSQISFPISVEPNAIQQGRRKAQVKVKMDPLEESINLVVLDSLLDRWHNASLRWDVDGNGRVDPMDVLMTINEINTNGLRQLDNSRSTDRSLLFVDINDDGFLDPLDALGIINFINAS